MMAETRAKMRKKKTTPAQKASPEAMRRPLEWLAWPIRRIKIRGRTGSTQGMILMDSPARIASR